MNLSLAINYHLHESKKSLLIFYGIILGLQLITVAPVLVNADITVSSSGLEVATIIYLFVIGLNSFRVPFLFFLVNGVSRKTMFKSTAISFVILSAIMAVVDNLSGLIFHALMEYKTFFEMIYGSRYGIDSFQYSPLFLFERLVWLFCVYLLAIFVGYFITVLYYRMDLKWKYIVSIGVPLLLFYGLPTAIWATDEDWFVLIIQTIGLLFGIREDGTNPYIAMLTLVASAIIFAMIGYMLTRKASIKKS